MKLNKQFIKISILFVIIAMAVFSWGCKDPEADIVVSENKIEGFKAPVVGEKPITNINENKQFSGTVSWQPNNKTFVGKTSYIATITLTAKDGYTFNGIKENTFTVSGAQETTNPKGTGNTLTLTAAYPMTESEEITSLDIAGLDAPVVGQTPDTNVDEAAQYTATVSWYDEDAQHDNENPFAGEKAYTAKIEISPVNGYIFSENISITVNGVAPLQTEVTVESNTEIIVEKTFTKTEAAKVSDLKINIAPYTGNAIITNIDKDQYTVDATWYEVNFDGTEGKELDSSDLFESGQEYKVEVTITPKEGFTFKGVDTSKFTITNANADGTTINYDEDDDDKVKITARFTSVNATPIDNLDINVTAPKVGEYPQTVFYGDSYDGYISWDDGKDEYKGTLFAGEKAYTAKIEISPVNGYIFSEEITITVNEVEPPEDKVTVESNTKIIVEKTFPATEAAKVSELNLSEDAGVAAPVAGAKPVTSINEAQAQYTGTVVWDPTDNPFEPITTYTATVELTAKNGYTFNGVEANDFEADNATSIEITSTDNKNITVTVVFKQTGKLTVTDFELGLEAPVLGGSPDTDISSSMDQWGNPTVTWPDGNGNVLEFNKGEYQYKAKITLQAYREYTFTGVTAENFKPKNSDEDSINDGVDSVSIDENDGEKIILTLTFDPTAAIVIDPLNIEGIQPIFGKSPVTKIDNFDFTESVSIEWTFDNEKVVIDNFAAGIAYTAEIVLEAKTGYTFDGVAANSFTVTGTTDVSHAAGSGKSLTVTATFSPTPVFIGDTTTISWGTAEAEMVCASNNASTSPVSFPTNAGDNSDLDDGTATISRNFLMAKTELTAIQAVEILNWAIDAEKLSPPTYPTATAEYGKKTLLRVGTDYPVTYSPGDNFVVNNDKFTENYPVNLSWYGAVIFCNWLTEMRDGNTDNIVYQVRMTEGEWVYSETTIDESKSGYRLPNANEWEYAARYLGKTPDDEIKYDPIEKSGYYWTPGSYASGATSNNEASVGAVAWVEENSKVNEQPVAHPVAEKYPNALGIYDMNGNLGEWTATDCELENNASGFYECGDSYNYPWNAMNVSVRRRSSVTLLCGLRLVRTIP